LRERLQEVVSGLDPGADFAAALLEAACTLLEEVRERLEHREAALDLLVADGLLTLACEAAAFAEPDTLVERCQGMGPDGELGRAAARWAGRG
jgi:hypothetical protein